MTKTTSNYMPRAGTKVASAVAALLDGPMNGSDLARAIGVEQKQIAVTLRTARREGVIVSRIDPVTKLTMYGLGGHPETAEWGIAAPAGDKGAPALRVRPASVVIDDLKAGERDEFSIGVYSDGEACLLGLVSVDPTNNSAVLTHAQLLQIHAFVERVSGVLKG